MTTASQTFENLTGGTLALEHRYDVVELIGRAGFVTIYRGRQDPFDKPATIEVYDVAGSLSGAPGLVERLKAAAELGSKLRIDGLLRPLDYGELDAGLPFVVSERVEATPLERVLERDGTLSPRQTLGLVERLADILAPLHDRGIAHGSLHPRWVLVPDDALDAALLTHLQLDLTAAEMRQLDDLVLTRTRVEVLPPEMFDADEAAAAQMSIAGDVWALGVIAHRCLVGAHPFFDETSDASEGIVRLTNQEARPLAELGVEADVAAAIDRALSRDPQARYDDAADFAAALRQAIAPADAEQAPAAEAAGRRPAPVEAAPAEPTPAEPAPAPAAEAEPAPEPVEREPGPSDLLLTVAIGLLIASNLAWVFYVTSSRPSVPPAASNVVAADGSSAGVLPRGIEIDSEPAQATVFEIGEADERPLGQTPFVFDPRRLKGDSVELELRKAGYTDTRIRVRSDGSQPRLVVPLREE